MIIDNYDSFELQIFHQRAVTLDVLECEKARAKEAETMPNGEAILQQIADNLQRMSDILDKVIAVPANAEQINFIKKYHIQKSPINYLELFEILN